MPRCQLSSWASGRGVHIEHRPTGMAWARGRKGITLLRSSDCFAFVITNTVVNVGDYVRV